MAEVNKPSLIQDAYDAARSAEQAIAVSLSALSHGSNEHDEPIHSDIRFESRDISGKNVLLTGAGVLVLMWVTISLIYFYFSFLSNLRNLASQPVLPVARYRTLPPAPRLQPSPREDLHEYDAREDSILTHYWWIDRKNGVVRIPIERAIQLIAQRGIPPQRAPKGMEFVQPDQGTRSTGFEGKVAPEPR